MIQVNLFRHNPISSFIAMVFIILFLAAFISLFSSSSSSTATQTITTSPAKPPVVIANQTVTTMSNASLATTVKVIPPTNASPSCSTTQVGCQPVLRYILSIGYPVAEFYRDADKCQFLMGVKNASSADTTWKYRLVWIDLPTRTIINRPIKVENFNTKNYQPVAEGDMSFPESCLRGRLEFWRSYFGNDETGEKLNIEEVSGARVISDSTAMVSLRIQGESVFFEKPVKLYIP